MLSANCDANSEDCTLTHVSSSVVIVKVLALGASFTEDTVTVKVSSLSAVPSDTVAVTEAVQFWLALGEIVTVQLGYVPVTVVGLGRSVKLLDTKLTLLHAIGPSGSLIRKSIVSVVSSSSVRLLIRATNVGASF
jgi:hypothetical protein